MCIRDRIISMLGAGGMGEVYLAQDLRLGRKVALKMLLPELTLDESDLRRFEHEEMCIRDRSYDRLIRSQRDLTT